MKLTQRDRNLLLGVLLVAIWALGLWFVIKPKIGDVKDAKKALQDQKDELVNQQNIFATYENVEKDIGSTYQQSCDIAKNFYNIDTVVNCDGTINKLLEGDNYTVDAFTISAPSSLVLQPYNYKASQLKVPIMDYADINRVKGAKTNSVKTQSLIGETLLGYSVTVEYKSTTLNDIFHFLNNLPTNDEKSLLVTSISLDLKDTDDEGKPKDGDPLTWKLDGSFTLELYNMPPPKEPILTPKAVDEEQTTSTPEESK